MEQEAAAPTPAGRRSQAKFKHPDPDPDQARLLARFVSRVSGTRVPLIFVGLTLIIRLIKYLP